MPRRLIAGSVVLALVAMLGGCVGNGTTTVTQTVTTHTHTPTTSGASAGSIVTPTAADEQRLSKDCDGPCVDFEMPSRNIKCFAYGGSFNYISCDLLSSPAPPWPDGSKCPAGFGDVSGLRVGDMGPVTLSCHTDVPVNWTDPHQLVLAYGSVWHGFGAWCISQPTGITCLNGDGHGFFLSRQRWKTF